MRLNYYFDNQKKNLENQIINNDSINNKLISIRSNNDNKSIDMNNENGLILKKRRKSYQTTPFNLLKETAKKNIFRYNK